MRPICHLCVAKRIATLGAMREIVETPLKAAERKRLAEIAHIGEPYLYQCLTGRRDMNPAKALEIERATGGELTRQMLCRTTWEGIWPELRSHQAA